MAEDAAAQDDGGIDPLNIDPGGDPVGGGGGSSSPSAPNQQQTTTSKKDPNQSEGVVKLDPMKRPGWLGNAPGAYSGSINDISNALRIIGEIAEMDKGNGLGCYYGTGFDETGEPMLAADTKAAAEDSNVEYMPDWAYSRSNWQLPKSSNGDPYAGKGKM